MSTIYLIRHGQATVGRFNYDNLSTLGHEQSALLGKAFRKRLLDVNKVRHGSLQRHLQTLEGFRSNFLLTGEIESHRDWDEYDHLEIIQRYKPYYKNRWVMVADMMKKLNPRRDFKEMFFKAMDKWMSGQYDDHYNESWPEFKDRTQGAFQKLTDDLGDSEKVLVFTSGGVISSIILRALDLPDSYFMRFNKKLVNCSVTKFVKNEHGLLLSTINDHSVFENKQELITYI